MILRPLRWSFLPAQERVTLHWSNRSLSRATLYVRFSEVKSRRTGWGMDLVTESVGSIISSSASQLVIRLGGFSHCNFSTQVLELSLQGFILCRLNLMLPIHTSIECQDNRSACQIEILRKSNSHYS